MPSTSTFILFKPLKAFLLLSSTYLYVVLRAGEMFSWLTQVCLTPVAEVFRFLLLTGSQNIAIYDSIFLLSVYILLCPNKMFPGCFSLFWPITILIFHQIKKRRLLKYFTGLKFLLLSPLRSTSGAASEWFIEIRIYDGPTNVSVALVMDCSEPVLNLFWM